MTTAERRAAPGGLVLLPTLLLLLGLDGARGAPTTAQPCPSGNLLAGAALHDSLDVQGAPGALIDGAVFAEGAPWNGDHGVRLLTSAGSLTYDLGRDLPIAAAFVQADARGAFSLQVSADGSQFREIWRVHEVREKGPGMWSRFTTLEGARGRFLRFGEPGRSKAPYVSELQVFCEVPDVWPPAVRMITSVGSADERAGPPLTRRTASLIKMAMALAGAGLLALGGILRRRGAEHRHRRLRDALLALLGILGFAAYFNWGGCHLPGRVHNYEFFHYFIGAKYFPELGYAGLYACANLAEAEQGYRRRVELRSTRDLHTNALVLGASVLERPESCTRGFVRPFTPARWDAFRKDIAFFRERMGVLTWEKALKDHGYNPSPAWNVAGSLLANLGPASTSLIDGFLAWIDPLLLLIAFGLIAWAFGWRTACVAALFFGTNAPASYFWTGGAFLRQDWFLGVVAGICLLKRARPLAGGACLGLSALLRVFPVGFLVPVVLRVLWLLHRDRRLDPAGTRILAGAVLAALIAIPVSGQVAGGLSAWPEFVRNTAKHADTPLTNYMGLRTALGFRWEERSKDLYDPERVDPLERFREARRETFRGPLGLPLFLALAGSYAALLFLVSRREQEWWALASLGFGPILIGTELTCYYVSFLTTAALLGTKRGSISVGLLALAGVTQLIELSTYYYDVRFFLQSLVALGFVVWATASYARSCARGRDLRSPA